MIVEIEIGGTIPIDESMAEIILIALGVADHESQIPQKGEPGREDVVRIVRVIKPIYPDAVERLWGDEC